MSAGALLIAVATILSSVGEPVRAPLPPPEPDLRPVAFAERIELTLPPSRHQETPPRGTNLRYVPALRNGVPVLRIESPRFIIEARKILVRQQNPSGESWVSLMQAESASVFDVVSVLIRQPSEVTFENLEKYLLRP